MTPQTALWHVIRHPETILLTQYVNDEGTVVPRAEATGVQHQIWAPRYGVIAERTRYIPGHPVRDGVVIPPPDAVDPAFMAAGEAIQARHRQAFQRLADE